MALTVEIMILMLDTDPLVSPAWLPHLWQFCQALNLYYGKRLKVDLGNRTSTSFCIEQLLFLNCPAAQYRSNCVVD